MANIVETVSSLSDFFTKLTAFLVGEGWTSDQLDTGAGKWAMSKTGLDDDIFVQTRWDTTDPQYFGVYQSTAFDGTGTDPGNHTGDSGNGAISGSAATIITARHVWTGVPIRYWAFADTGYCHVVVERTSGGERQVVHWGFGGNIDKINDWPGGAYAYGFRFNPTSGTVAVLEGTTVLLDGLSQTGGLAPSDMYNFVATMRLTGFPNQPASQWGTVQGSMTATGTDRASNARARLVGGARGGPIARAFARFQTRNTQGLMPGYPILVWYWDSTDGSVQPLGWMKDVRGVNMEFFSVGDELTVGAETWVLFPTWEKDTGALTNTSGYQGWAYRKF
jgi:hypothetical protein